MTKSKDVVAADRKKLDQLVRKAKLERYADVIRESTKIAIELVPKRLAIKGVPDHSQLPLTQSRFGGHPDFPQGDDEWPETNMFVAELNLGEIAYYVGAELVPVDGLASFFVLDGEDDDGDYLGTGLVQHDSYKQGAMYWRLPSPEELDIKTLPCAVLTFVPRITIPHPDTSEAKVLKLKGDAATAYNDIVYAEMPKPRHQLFGYKNTDLDDTADEVLLLSLASDKKLGMQWGDGNRLNFHIKKKHFAKGRLHEAYPVYVDA